MTDWEDKYRMTEERKNREAKRWLVRGILKWVFIATAVAAGVGVGLWVFA